MSEREIERLIAETVKEEGCIEFKVFQDLDDGDRFILWEIFSDKEVYPSLFQLWTGGVHRSDQASIGGAGLAVFEAAVKQTIIDRDMTKSGRSVA